MPDEALAPTDPLPSELGSRTDTCAACHEPLRGPYCYACGERTAHDTDESLGHFLKEQFHEVTSADGKLWRTLRALAIPGKLTAEYFAGRRGRYVRPIRLFLVVNVVLFFILSFTNGNMMQAPLDSMENRPDWSFYEPYVERQIERWDISAEVYEAHFNAHGAALTRSLLVLLAPLLALMLALVMAGARTASSVRHLIFATHTISTLIALIIALVAPLMLALLLWIALTDQTSLNSIDPLLMPLLLVLELTYFIFGIRRAYSVRWRYAIPAGLTLGTAGLFIVYVVYRGILAALTIATLDPPLT